MPLPTGYPCSMELIAEICWTKSQKSPLSHEGSAGFEKPGYYTMKPNPEGFSGLTRILLGKPREYKGLKGKGRIPTDDLIPKNRLCRNQHLTA